jgi:hypothetical protein
VPRAARYSPMDEKYDKKLPNGHNQNSGILNKFPPFSQSIFSVQPSEIANSGFAGFPETEIRSQVSIWKSATSTADNAYESVGELVFKALDVTPIWVNHLLIRRRPDIAEISNVLTKAFFDHLSDYLTVPFEDIVVVLRFRSAHVLEACAIVTVEPAYAGGEICYWLRCSIYEGSEGASLITSYLRCLASFYGVLDYPDSCIIDELNYAFYSRSKISSYVDHPSRTQTIFLIPKSTTDRISRKIARAGMAGALIPFGVIGELTADGIREITGIELTAALCAIAIPPNGSDSPDPRIVLEAPNSKDEKILTWTGMSDYLRNARMLDAPWLSEIYEMHPVRDAATNYARLILSVRGGVVHPYRANRGLEEHIRSTTDQPGWDLYSPLPRKEEAGLPAEGVVPPAFEIPLEPNNPNTVHVADAAFEEWTSDDSIEVSPHGDAESGYPASLSELPSWVERTLSSKLELAPRAVREMKKVHHPQPERIAQALELLAGPRRATFQGDRSSTRAFHQGLETLRLRDGFSGAERLAGRTGSDYVLSHRGKTSLLERHLASNSSGFNDPKMIRVYYFYDQDSDKIIVGWLPTHLQTSKS